MKQWIAKVFFHLKRLSSFAMIAFMLGISNVFLQEDRMINDSRKKLEQKKIQDEDDSLE